LKPEAISLGAFAGLRWQQGSIPVLALHGWLDNAHSFLPLAPTLDGLDVVALDFPGHGLSAPRPADVRYHFDDYVFDVLAALDALDWHEACLLGHSLGGAVASITAAAAPERICALALIEGLGPLSTPVSETATNWRKAVARSESRERRVHANREAAAAARAFNSDLGLDAARLLAQRGVVEDEGGVRWQHDQRLTWPSPHRYTEAQVLDLLGAIQCPVLSIHAQPRGSIIPETLARRRFAALPRRHGLGLPGGHHLHMHHPDRVGPAIKEHFQRHGPSPRHSR
jgi:pimeloyl-ACP methyl ester carboxylesterase